MEQLCTWQRACVYLYLNSPGTVPFISLSVHLWAKIKVVRMHHISLLQFNNFELMQVHLCNKFALRQVNLNFRFLEFQIMCRLCEVEEICCCLFFSNVYGFMEQCRGNRCSSFFQQFHFYPKICSPQLVMMVCLSRSTLHPDHISGMESKPWKKPDYVTCISQLSSQRQTNAK